MAKKILMRKGNQKLIGVVITEGSKQRIAVMLYQESKNGEISVPSIIQRSELLKKSKALQDLLNLSICLTEEELDTVIERAIQLLESADQVDEAENMDNRSTPSQLYRAICEHGKEVVSDLIIDKESEEPRWQIWLDRDYLNIRTSDFADFIKEVPEADEYKKTDILRSLKLLGVLDADTGRAYDKKVSKGNKKINCYRIQMPASKLKKTIVEETEAVEPAEETKSVEVVAEVTPAEQAEGVQMTIEEILQEQDKAEETPIEPIPAEEKLLAGLKEMIAEESAIKIDPIIPSEPRPQPKPIKSEEDYGGFSF